MSRTYLDNHEIVRLEGAADYVRDKLLIRLLFHLGCRVSEALGIALDDVDFTKGTVMIKHLKTRLKLSCAGCGARLGATHVFCPKCGAKVEGAIAREQEHRRTRTLPIDDATLRLLKDYIVQGGAVEKGGKRLIFGINRHRVWQIVKECAERAGLPRLVNPETGKTHNVSPHRLRGAFAVRAMKLDNSGDGLRLLQEHLGHASFNTTAKYRKVAGEELKGWYAKLWQEEKKADGPEAN